MPTELDKPTDFLTLTTRTGDKEIFMSVGLRSLLMQMATIDDIVEIHTNLDLQNAIMIECLRPRKENGQPEGEYTLFQCDMASDQSTKLTKWVSDHLLYFFTESTQNGKEAVLGPRFKKLTELLVGLQASAVSMQSVGPSTQPPADA